MTQHRPGAATTKRKGKAPAEPVTACAFGCGKAAEGGLSVYFSNWTTERDSQRSRAQQMSIMLPACWECARGAVKMSVVIPKQ